MNETIEYIIRLQDQISGKLAIIEKNTDKMNNSIDRSTGLFKKLGVVAASVFAVNKLVQYGSEVVNLGAKFEAYEIGLSTLTGSAEKARQVFNNIKTDARTTPFDTESLLMANRALISSGVDAKQARIDVLNLANAIAATGGGNDELQRMSVNLQQIKNVGKATALDIKQFAYAGINIYELLAKSTGKSRDQVKNMEVTYEQLTAALARANAAGGLYAGGLDKMGKSAAVQISNLKDTISFIAVDVFNAVKPALSEVLGVVNDLLGEFKNYVPTILETFRPLWGIIKDIGRELFDVARIILPEIFALLKPIFSLVGMVWDLVKEVINPIKGELQPLLAYIRDLVSSIVEVFRGLMPVLRPIFKLIGAVASVVIHIAVGIEKARLAVYKWITDTRIFKAIWDGVSYALEKVVGWISKVVDGVKELLGMGGAKEKGGFWDTVTNAVTANSGAGGSSEKGGAGMTPITPVKDVMTSKPESAKLTNINISIQDLVKNFNIVTQRVEQSEAQIKEVVVKALLGAVNGYNVVPGQ